MSKTKEKTDTAASNALSLFDTDSPEGQEGSLDQTALVKAAMSEAIRRSTRKRFDIAYQLSCWLGRPITEDMLNQLTSSKEEYQLKAGQMVAFCVAVGNWILFERLLDTQNRRLLDPKDVPALRLADALRKKQQAEREIALAQRELE